MSEITIEKLTFTFPYESKPALNNINLSIEHGEFFCLVGTSGCGKSTLGMCLNGLIPHRIFGRLQGDVIISGQDIKKCEVADLAQIVGMVFQNPESQLISLSVEDELRFGLENLGAKEEDIDNMVVKVLKSLEIEDLKNRSPEQLSSGQKKRVAIASVLVMKPKILVLDEPTANLDPISSEEIFKIILDLKREGITIFLIEHDIEKVTKYADRIAVMHEGQILLDGKPREVMSSDIIYEYIYPPKTCIIAKRLIKKGYKFKDFPLTPEELAPIIRSKKNKTYHNNVKSSSEPIIVVKNLSFSYEQNELTLKNINLTIYKNEFLAIVGRNGSGKSTLALHINGLLKPNRGVILVKGIDTKKIRISELATIVGYVFQNPDAQLFEDTVEKEISFGPSNLLLSKEEVKKRTDEAIKYCGLEDVREKDPFSLSMGQAKRVTIASILAMKPEIIVIDEPTTGLDTKTAEKMMTLIKNLNELGHTIILITHDMEIVAEYANRIIALNNGEIIADCAAREFFSADNLIRKAYVTRPEISKLGSLIGDPNLLKFSDIEEFLEGLPNAI